MRKSFTWNQYNVFEDLVIVFWYICACAFRMNENSFAEKNDIVVTNAGLTLSPGVIINQTRKE